MAGLRDLFDNTKGVFERGMRRTTEMAADAFDRVRGNPTGGLRDAEPKVSSSVETPEARQSRLMNEMNARQSAKSAAAGKPLSEPQFHGQTPPEITTATPEEIKAKKLAGGGLRGKLATAGKFAKPIAGVLAVGDAAMKANAGQTPEQLANIAGGGLGGSIEALDNITSIPGLPQSGVGRPFVHAAAAGIGHILGDDQSEAAAAADPRVGMRHSAGRFLTAVGAGWNKGAALNASGADTRPPASAQAPAQPPQVGKMPPAQRVDDVQVPSQDRLDPAGMLAGTARVPEGTGAFQITTPGKVGKPRAVDSRAANLRDQQAQVAASQRMGPAGFLGGVASHMAQVKGAQAGANAETSATAVKLKAAQMQLQMRASGEKALENEVKNEAARDPAIAALPKEQYAQALAQKTADLAQRYTHTAASIGVHPGDLTPVMRSQMRLANQFRTRLEEKGRTGIDAFLTNFFGNKQTDSENLFNYVPEKVEDAPFGAMLTMRGGNPVRVNKVVRNGETHWFAPNDPTNSDLTALVEAARKNTKGNK